MSIENIVRPFQTPDFAPAKPYFTPGKAGQPNIILQFGRGGGGKTLSGSSNSNATYYMTQYVNEEKDADFGTED